MLLLTFAKLLRASGLFVVRLSIMPGSHETQNHSTWVIGPFRWTRRNQFRL